jgi:hypothetical protein
VEGGAGAVGVALGDGGGRQLSALLTGHLCGVCQPAGGVAPLHISLQRRVDRAPES